MTIARIGPGLWELRSRHGALFGTGDLYTVVTLWPVPGFLEPWRNRGEVGASQRP